VPLEKKRVSLSVVGAALACVTVSAAPGAAAPLEIQSRHYRILTDLDEPAARDYAKRLDAMYDEYARRLSDFGKQQKTKFDVYLFKKRSGYLKFTNNRLPNSAGIFIPAQRALAAYEEGQGRGGLRQTLQHEAFHQFAWECISNNLPIWLDEGLAQVFEEGVWAGDKFILGQVPPRRIEDLQADLKAGRLTPLGEMLSMPRNAYQARMKDAKTARALYNQAWAMTQFLVFAQGEDGKPRYRDRFLAWLRDMHAGRDAQAAFSDNFSGNVDGFEQRFREWVGTLQPTPMAVYSDRLTKLAELLRLFRRDGLSFDSVEQLRDHLVRGRFHLTEQRDGETVMHQENALTYLSDLKSRQWTPDQMRFERRRGPLPDVVLSPPNGMAIRVRFFKVGNEIDHELSFEMR
jgi:hypothetical protein